MVGEGMSPPREVYAFNSTIVNLLKAVKERVFYVKVNGVFQAPPKPGSRPSVKASEIDGLGDCGICKSQYTVWDYATQLACGHTYHTPCIVSWIDVL